ncbi:MAG TPA: geranylgeranyl reductase family protein [Rubrivivax sp.]|nr:geranylgeranyl reductase family protein [Burkholderiales bacterium]HNT37964.1 geranylgeranyl reductase family protein [Rubrivivax sp.]
MPDSATTTPVALPGACDVAVIGAGPAGSAAAWQLARRGLDVVLVDQHVFPRDKVCGDGLIPDAHAALARMGVLEEVMARARRVPFVRCTGPRGRHVDVPGRLAVLPRVQLDHLLLQCAERAGARCLMPARFEAPLLEGGGRVVGVRLRVGQETHALAARWVVLATGASVQGLLASGLCERRTPSGIAMRGYVRSEIMVGRITGLEIFWHPRLAGGYGWIFPAPEGCFNIGAGLTGSHAVERGDGGLRMQDINLKRLFEAFCEVYAPARELMATGALQGELRGAPLRCSLGGARWSRAGLLAAGEAAGSTYAFTGEGIGKALETGLLAGEAIDLQATDEAVRARYEAALQALRPRFALYEQAAHVNHRPWLTDLVIWRAQRSPRILQRMSGVLEETQNPGRLLSWRGITKLMFE